MTQLLTADQAQLLDELLAQESADHVMFMRYERDYLTQYPALFEIEPVDLMRALSTGYEREQTPVEKWCERYNDAITDIAFLKIVDSPDYEKKGAAKATKALIEEMDADFKLGILNGEATEK